MIQKIMKKNNELKSIAQIIMVFVNVNKYGVK